MTTKFWTNQTVNLQTVLGAAKTMTAITKASNGVATCSGGDLPTNGDWILLEVTGMRQAHRRVGKVSGATGTTFNIGLDTTDFDTFVSGTFKKITFGASFSSLRDITSSGGDAVFEDTTTIHDADQNQAIVGSSPLTYSGTNDWEVTNAALIEANKAYIARTPRAFQMVDPDGTVFNGYGYVLAPLHPIPSGKKKVTPIAFTLLAPGTTF